MGTDEVMYLLRCVWRKNQPHTHGHRILHYIHIYIYILARYMHAIGYFRATQIVHQHICTSCVRVFPTGRWRTGQRPLRAFRPSSLRSRFGCWLYLHLCGTERYKGYRWCDVIEQQNLGTQTKTKRVEHMNERENVPRPCTYIFFAYTSTVVRCDTKYF